MKFQPIKTYLTRTALVVGALALTGCATTMGGISPNDSNAEASSHGKEKETSAVVLEEKPSEVVNATEMKKRKKMTPEERRKLVEFYKELVAVS